MIVCEIGDPLYKHFVCEYIGLDQMIDHSKENLANSKIVSSEGGLSLIGQYWAKVLEGVSRFGGVALGCWSMSLVA